MDRECRKLLRDVRFHEASVLEISGHAWESEGFKSYTSEHFPDFDICEQKLPLPYDLIIAEQVFEHLLWPYRAGKHIYEMLKPGGHFLITTPFLNKIHNYPVDCTRWTPLGLRHFLAECGFPIDSIKTGSWGNRQCVKENLDEFLIEYDSAKHSLNNEPDFPYHVWALAKR